MQAATDPKYPDKYSVTPLPATQSCTIWKSLKAVEEVQLATPNKM
jgi:hypothetical protein